VSAVVVIGVSHPRTPVHLRERLRLRPADAAALARSLTGSGCEAVLLPTCNRSEIYLAGDCPAAAERRAQRALAELGGCETVRRATYVVRDEDAARHLLRVGSGLESIVLGDMDVAAQVGHAHAASHVMRH
jgi:glutamyl-tRNA reductase